MQAETAPRPEENHEDWWDQLSDVDVSVAAEEARSMARQGILEFTAWTHHDYRINWHHRIIAQHVDDFVSGKIKRLIIAAPPRTGKALSLDTPIPTPSGWKTMGEIEVGDQVFDEAGIPCSVIAKSPIFRDRECFRVVTDDGDESIVADESHEWVVRLDRKWKAFRTYTTGKLAGRSSPRKPMITRQPGLVLNPAPLPIPPYTFGVWLGDGCNHHATITQGDKDFQFVRDQVGLDGFVTSDRKTAGTFGVLGLQKPLRELGLIGKAKKFIPPQYLRGSREQRLALLQGIMDSDGYADPRNGCLEICTIYEEFAFQIQELVRSLGVKCGVNCGTASLNGRFISKKWRIVFWMKDAARLPRKRVLCRNGVKQPNTYVSFERVAPTDTVCIQVDAPNSMFLAGLSMTPTHNSELVSRRMPAYILGKNPDARIISTSYSADLANAMSRDVQRTMMSQEYAEIFPDTKLSAKNVSSEDGANYRRAADEFEVIDHRGSYKCTGVGGGITGRGADFILIDDPIRSREDANSLTKREKLWDWFRDDLKTRLDGDGGILVMSTRWHLDDLTGRLLTQMREDPDADQWVVLELPARLDDGMTPHPDDHRAVGEPLWPWFFAGKRDGFTMAQMTAKALERLSVFEHSNPMGFAALMQQNPTIRDGGMFDPEKLVMVSTRPAKIRSTVRYWDKAGIEGGGCFTAGVKISLLVDGRFLIEDVVHGQWSALNRENNIRDTTVRDGYSSHVYVEQEPGSGGKESAESTIRNLAGYLVHADRPTGDKQTRAEPFAAQVEAGNVLCMTAPWNNKYKDELRAFPNGRYVDMVDASTGAFNKLVQPNYAGLTTM